MIKNIYACNYDIIVIFVTFVILLWCIINIYSNKIWVSMNVFGAIVSVIIILSCTVFGRTNSNVHQFVFFADYTNEFYREMFMNTFLYVPLGLTLTVVIGPRSIFFGLLLSMIIEIWQFCAGTGLSQGSDVICNTIGVVIGSLPFWIRKLIIKFRKMRLKDE